jgi:hypothetical protein
MDGVNHQQYVRVHTQKSPPHSFLVYGVDVVFKCRNANVRTVAANSVYIVSSAFGRVYNRCGHDDRGVCVQTAQVVLCIPLNFFRFYILMFMKTIIVMYHFWLVHNTHNPLHKQNAAEHISA